MKAEGIVLKTILIEFAKWIMNRYYIATVGDDILTVDQLVNNFIKEKMNESK